MQGYHGDTDHGHQGCRALPLPKYLEASEGFLPGPRPLSVRINFPLRPSDPETLDSCAVYSVDPLIWILTHLFTGMGRYQ